MKFFLLTTLTLLLLACSDRQGQLTGKWQKIDDSRVIIEFTESGQYYLAINGEKVPPQHYGYRPDSKENNLQIGEDTAVMVGHVQFLKDNRILITTTRPPAKRGLEYRKIR